MISFSAPGPVPRRKLPGERLTDGWRADALAVCVPVRDEQALLPLLLDALASQRVPSGLPVTLCFWLDNCRDRSEQIVRGAIGLPFPVVTAGQTTGAPPDAGLARRNALALGERISHPGNLALLTTDADTVPGRDWIGATCDALAAADVVAGRILRESDVRDPLPDRIEAYYDRLYSLRRRYDPVAWEARPAHHHVGGASLAFRAAAYDAVGGFKAGGSGEDAAIVDEAQRMGFRARRDRDVVVETSARRHGRAVNGFADHLRALDSFGASIALAHPEDAAWQYRGHAAARASYPHLASAGVVDRLATRLMVERAHVRRVAASARNAEAFATHVVPTRPGKERKVGLDEAEALLAALECGPCARAA